MSIVTEPIVAARPEVAQIPAVLDVKAIQAILGVSRPTANEIAHACNPIRIGRLIRVLGEDFRAWLETQR